MVAQLKATSRIPIVIFIAPLLSRMTEYIIIIENEKSKSCFYKFGWSMQARMIVESQFDEPDFLQ